MISSFLNDIAIEIWFFFFAKKSIKLGEIEILG